MNNRLSIDFFNRDADVVAKELLGKELVMKACGGCYFVWRIIETEAYKEEENTCGETICHTDKKMRSSGHIFAEGSNGLIITCGPASSCDNVLIRGLIGIFNKPNIAMHAFCMDGYLGKKSDNLKIDLTTSCDLTSDGSFVYVQESGNKQTSDSICTNNRVNVTSEKLWNFKLVCSKSTVV